MEEKTYDPNAPAFEEQESPAESEEEHTEEPTPSGSEGEPARVPYERFQKVYEQAKKADEAERRAQEAERRALEAEQRASQAATVRPSDEDSTDWLAWVNMHGDSDASKKAYEFQKRKEQEFFARMEERAEQRALEALENRTSREREVIASNMGTIDNRLEGLSEYLGRELTEQEQDELLDIVDEYTPKDDDGNYAGELIPFDKAWEIREMKNSVQKSNTRRSRDTVSSISAAPSNGDPSKQQDDSLPRWGSWRKRFQE